MESTYSFFATAPKGIESVLVKELNDLGAVRVKQIRAGASFSGDLQLGYRACLWLRTANRVFLVLDSFKADTIDDLYDGIRHINWSDHMSSENTFAVDFHSNQSIVKHTHFGALKVKDAIVDQFREKYNIRPSIDTSLPDLRINVHMNRKKVTVSLDLSGISLHKRGYRSDKGLAPLKENLAATILIRSGWPEISRKGGGFIDPMCGSGTLPIEAAMIAGDMAPGLLREYFGFLKWRQHKPEVWQMLVDEAEEIELERRPDIPPIIGYDQDAGAIKDSIANMERAGLHGLVHFEKRTLSDLAPHPGTIDNPGLMVVNPPYGERLGRPDDLKKLYTGLGIKLRSSFGGWHAAVFTGNSKLAKAVNIKPARTDKFFNGNIACDLIQYHVSTDLTEALLTSAGLVHSRSSVYQPSEEIKMFENRVKKNLKRLKSWRTQNSVSCFRVYDRDIPEYAVAVDIYDQWIHVQEYKAPKSISPETAMNRLKDIVFILPSIFDVPAENIFLKQRHKQKRTSQYGKQSDLSKTSLVNESGLTFEINLESYIDTGLFPDHRLTRSMIEQMAGGKRFLNLFSYTATATVYAARGGALSTTSVDKSNTYTRWAKKNMRLNGFDQDRHVFHSADCLSWMKKEKTRYDLIFLDTPTFSNTKKTGSSFDIQKDHPDLILSAVNLLTDDGTLIFSNNYRQFKMDLKTLRHLRIEDIT
ncbi:MAG: bifunctional 23S rRNA (guanine(2069)-N(7))-methyltransferase RlmK/23S rRNA (guanine(2445)-N(2))-methyltransferase RlmL, partial [Desulfobacteraceae bacterium]